MSIVFRNEVYHDVGAPDMHCPIVVCDWCGEHIKTVADGTVYREFTEGAYHIPIFAHKRCAWATAKEYESRGMYLVFTELATFLAQLVNNTGVHSTRVYNEIDPRNRR